MGVLVSVAVMKVFHELGRGVPDGKGHREVAGFFHQGESIFQCHIGTVALGGRGQIDRRLRQRNPSFRHADLGNHLEAGIGQKQCIRIGKPHIFRCRQAQTPGNEQRVFARIDHPGQVIDGGIGVGAPDALDEGGDDIVVHLPVLVIHGHVFLDTLRNRLIINNNRFFSSEGVHDDFQDVQQFPAVAAAEAHQSLRLLQPDILRLQEDIFAERTVQQDLQILPVQGFQDKNLAAGEQGRNDLEGRILRRRTDQDDGARFHGPEQGILLRLVEAVDFVDEQDRSAPLAEQTRPPGFLEHLPDILDAGRDCGEGIELAAHRFGDDMGQGRLSYAGRAPENERRQVPALDHLAEDAAFPDQMPLAHILVQRIRTHPFRKGREQGTRGGHTVCRSVRFPC